MLFWKKKAPAVPESSVFGTWEWFNSLSLEDVVKLVQHIESQAGQLADTRGFEYTYQKNEMFNEFRTLFEVLAQLNREDEVQLKMLYDALFYTVTPILTELGSAGNFATIKSDTTEAYTKRFSSRRDHVTQALAKHIPYNLFHGLDISGATKSLMVKTTYPVVNNNTRVILQRLQSVQMNALAAEDQYFVGQIESSYLPEIVASAEKMRHLAGADRDAASSNFATQLKLIEDKLESVIQESSTRMLTEVRNTTSFLTESLKKDSGYKAISQ